MAQNKRLYLFTAIIVIIVIIAFIYSGASNSTPKTSYYTNNIVSTYNSKNGNSVVKKVKTHLSKVVLAKNFNYPFFSLPSVSGDYSFVDTANYFQTYGVKNPHYEGSVIKINNETGNIVWKTTLPNLIMSNPTVISQINKVFVGIGNDAFFRKNGKLMRGTGISGIYALNISTGKIIWKFNTIGQRKATPVYKNGVLYSIGGNRILYALSAINGKVLWSLNYGSISSASQPLIIGNNLYFGGSYPYYLFDVNIVTHKIVWKDNFGKMGINGGLDDVTPAYNDGYIYTDASQLINPKTNEGYDYLYKINANTGNIIWKLKEGYGKLNFPHGAQKQGSIPAVVGHTIYVGSNAAQKIFAVNTNTGKIIWSNPSIGSNIKPFIVVGNLVYYYDGEDIQIYNKSNGKYIGTRTTGGKVAGSGMTYVNGRFYVVNVAGDFYIFK
ncbi:PQQ-binding-like beta-propeller repeat protein [Patescibacteria group bacterium]|nr:PQQ-binding-like beta-propeller repeat protein [Patescibacteria group bacterium]